MRTAVTSVGAVLDDLQRDLHAGSAVAGVITTLPVICFALLGAATPRLAHSAGPHRLLVAALSLMTVGLVLRPLSSGPVPFALLSVAALAGGAIANVLMPSLVKRHFPDRIGPMTAVYTTALAVGTTAAAGLTVPIADAAGTWRVGLGAWAIFSAVAALPWLAVLRGDRPEPGTARGLSPMALRHSATAWALMLCFGFQSLQAYVAFGWFAKFLHAHAISTATAGWMVALFSALSIPVSMIAPSVPQRHMRAALSTLSGCYLVAYVGLALAPAAGAWAWMVLAGIGSGTFPMVLSWVGMRSRSAETTAALSAFVQAAGYLIAGCGPLLFGVLYSATGSWAAPLALLFAALVITAISGWVASRSVFVDDELGIPSAARGS
jgi:CP family cyanate transporter-like MFS transporter